VVESDILLENVPMQVLIVDIKMLTSVAMSVGVWGILPRIVGVRPGRRWTRSATLVAALDTRHQSVLKGNNAIIAEKVVILLKSALRKKVAIIVKGLDILLESAHMLISATVVERMVTKSLAVLIGT